METKTHPQQPMRGSVTVEEIIVKVHLAKLILKHMKF